MRKETEADSISKGYIKNDVIEFHVDDNELFMETTKNFPLQGRLSMRSSASERMRIVFGKDESACLPHYLKEHFGLKKPAF